MNTATAIGAQASQEKGAASLNLLELEGLRTLLGERESELQAMRVELNNLRALISSRPKASRIDRFDIVLALGVSLVSLGASLVYLPGGVIIAGASLVTAALIAARGATR